MAANTYSSEYTIDCPLFCGGESTIVLHGYDAPAEVSVCAKCAAQGGTGWTCTLGQADHYMRPVVTTTWQHADGLVTFR